MKENIKRAWIEALRSGEYQQTNGALHVIKALPNEDPPQPAGYCCLGVLCDLVVPSSGRGRLDDKMSSGVVRSVEKFYGEYSWLPADMLRTVGLRHIDPKLVIGYTRTEFISDPIVVTLSELNDGGFTFDQIADMIERFL